MKTEPTRFASLSSGLLARKGAARPAMRPQGYSQIGATSDDLGWNDMGFEPPRPSLAAQRDERHDAFGEELGGPAVRNPLAALTPASPVHSQQAELAERLAEAAKLGDDDAGDDIDETAELYDPSDAGDHFTPAALAAVVAEVPPVRAIAAPQPGPSPVAPRSATKAAFTLRLDAERHLRLRLASAVTARSAQQLLTEALDELLASMPDLDALAEQAPGAGKRVNRKG